MRLHIFYIVVIISGLFIFTNSAHADNSAPVLDSTKSPTFSTINEDAGAPSGVVGTTVTTFIDAVVPAGGLDNVTDVDGGTLGIAIISKDSSLTCYYTIDSGSTWSSIGSVSGSSARLLAAVPANRIYCIPGTDQNGTFASAITFRAWDQSSGVDGSMGDASSTGGTTAFSSATDTASLVVTAINDAPIATNLSAAETYTQNTTLNLTDIVVSDVDNANVTATLTLSNILAGALSTATSGTVTSTYLSGTGVWTASGPVSDVNTLLAGVTFTPATNFTSSFTIATNVSDGAASTTGSKSFSGISTNHAPVLDSSRTPALSSVNEDPGAPSGAVGTLVSNLVDFASPSGQVDNVTDSDGGAVLGIAITGANTTNATYYYSLNGGTTWNAMGTLSSSSSRLLASDSDNRIYVRPSTDFNGTITSAITFLAWDQTSGTDGSTASTASNGGTTAFSSASDTANIVINPVNDLPVAIDDEYTINENSGESIFHVLDNDYDVDSGDTLAIGGINNGSHGGVSNLDPYLGYEPDADYCGTDTFTYHVISSGGGTYDTGEVTVNITCADHTAPDTLILSSTAGSIDSSTATFEFGSNEDPSTFECNIDAGSFTSCVSPYTTSVLTAGQHEFSVRAIDGAENTDASPATSEWTIYSSVPEITSTLPSDGATGVSINTNVVFHFSETVPSGIRDHITISSGPCGEECPTLNGSWSNNYKTLTYTNPDNYEKNTEYTIDLSVNDSLVEHWYEFSFTTGNSSGGSGSRSGGTVLSSKVFVPTLNPVASNTESKYVFTRDLKIGSTGEDVKELQKFLNKKGFTVALSGPGSLGNESTTFGPRTKAALIKFQQANAISPSMGYFGIKTRNTVNGMLGN